MSSRPGTQQAGTHQRSYRPWKPNGRRDIRTGHTNHSGKLTCPPPRMGSPCLESRWGPRSTSALVGNEGCKRKTVSCRVCLRCLTSRPRGSYFPSAQSLGQTIGCAWCHRARVKKTHKISCSDIRSHRHTKRHFFINRLSRIRGKEITWRQEKPN